MSTTDLEAHFAQTGVDPLTSAFATAALPPAGHGKRPPAQPLSSVQGSTQAEHIAALKASMPAHATRVFEAWQAAGDDAKARASIEAMMPAHAIRALATLKAAIRETRGIQETTTTISDWARLVASTPAGGNPAPTALYVHFPFCAARCAFCPFYRYADPEDWRPYRDALLSEIKLAAAPFASPHTVDAVYFGGGTPSDLPGEALVSIITAIHREFHLSPDAEITVEGRPSTLDPDKVRQLRACGVNRFSLGVQTFDGAVRRAMGRRLDSDDLRRRIREIGAAAGEAPVIVDLIYGLPGQTDESWERDLDLVLAESAIGGVDLYRLKVFPGSPLARLTASGRSAPAGEADMARRFSRGVEKLDTGGFRRISRWHWARHAGERSRYNQLAKGEGDIIPLGCGAGGRWAGRAFMNTPALPEWTASVNAGEKPCPGLSPPAPGWRAPLSAQIEAGLLEPTTWLCAGPSALTNAYRLIAQWQQAGLLAHHFGGTKRLTIAGQYWSDRLLHALESVLSV